MTRSEIALLLSAIAGRDQRTIGETDVLAWHEDLGDLDYADARAAVARHFRESTDRIMPAHVRRLVRLIRDERRRGEVVRSLPPSRFEAHAAAVAQVPDDVPEERPAEVRKLLAGFAAQHAITELPEATPATPAAPLTSEAIHERALARARSERRGTRF
jgi:hypothetical protein